MEQVIRAAINSGAVHLQHLSKSLPRVLQPDAGAGGSERLVLALAAANVLALLLWPTSRRVIINALDTTLAIVLIACLVGIVVGLPIGALYLTFKALAYLASSLASTTAFSKLEAWVKATIASPA